MRLGISAFAWTAQFEHAHLHILSEMKSLGVSAFEVPMFDPAALPVDSIAEAFSTHEMECTVCAILPRPFNPISPDAAVRMQTVEHLTRCIQTAARMGASLIAGPLFAPIGYLPPHRPTRQEWNWAVEVFQSLSQVLDDCGISFAIEPVNRSETFFLRTASEAEQFCDAIGNERIGVTIDTFHANIEEHDIPAAIMSLGGNLKHMHISENDRGPLGRGHVPFAAIVSALKAIRYDGYLMIEGFGYDPAENSAPGALWASMDVSPSTFAVESAHYLNGLLG